MQNQQRIHQLMVGLSFGEAAFTDPIARTELMMECARVTHEHFGDVGLGSADPEPSPIASYSYGDRFMSALFDCEVDYFDDHGQLDIGLDPVLRMALYGKVQGTGRVRRQPFPDLGRVLVDDGIVLHIHAEGGGDVTESFQVVDTTDEDVFHTTILEFVEHG